jgi:hypothetical protein
MKRFLLTLTLLALVPLTPLPAQEPGSDDHLAVFNELKKKDMEQAGGAVPAESRNETPRNEGNQDRAGGNTTPAPARSGDKHNNP